MVVVLEPTSLEMPPNRGSPASLLYIMPILNRLLTHLKKNFWNFWETGFFWL